MFEGVEIPDAVTPRPACIVIARAASDTSVRALVFLDDSDEEIQREQVSESDLASRVSEWEERYTPRWIVRSLRDEYPPLLRAGVRLTRAWDLLLCHAILRDTALLTEPLHDSPQWRRTIPDASPAAHPMEPALFDWAERATRPADTVEELLAERARQRRALAQAPDGRLDMLCALESAGGLVAEEMTAAGVPWHRGVHEQILTTTLGERGPGGVPRHMLDFAREVRGALGDPQLSIDSPPKLLKALRNAGILVNSTSRWELAEHEHPAIAPLLAYKRLARLYTANGWAWLADWIHNDRFRPVYLPGGVVTGRWASAGGGALQIPRALRPAVRADDGWTLVVADVAQLEPRVLAAMAADTSMAEAAQGEDLYAGVVRSGAVSTREEAKYAVLGAMYGATSGDSGRLVPRLRSVFRRAMALVDEAARTGEEGGTVSTRLGRSSPPPVQAWSDAQSAASAPHAGPEEVQRARSRARERGRFTRNFIVQGTAAEWSLLWMAEIRHRLRELPHAATPAEASGVVFAQQAHLAFFLHDEIIVHAPVEHAEAAAAAVRAAAEAATQRLFGGFPIDMPLDLRIAKHAEK